MIVSFTKLGKHWKRNRFEGKDKLNMDLQELYVVCYLVLSGQVVGILGSELKIEVHTGDVDLGAVNSIERNNERIVIAFGECVEWEESLGQRHKEDQRKGHMNKEEYAKGTKKE